MKKEMKILIVDDNESICKTMSFILKRKGYAVATAYDGVSGVEQFRKDPADIVLSDVIMPEMNGVEMFYEIKKINPSAMVILVTAYAVNDLIREGIKAGAYGVLFKPLDIEKVIDIIELSKQPSSGQNILVVDDEEAICNMLFNFFTRQGFQVALAQSGQRAVELAKENTYLVVFVDMVMPGMNGLETFLKLQKILPDTKVVMMSGYKGKVDNLMSQAKEHGAYDILYKPFQLSELSSILQRIINESSRLN